MLEEIVSQIWRPFNHLLSESVLACMDLTNLFHTVNATLVASTSANEIELPSSIYLWTKATSGLLRSNARVFNSFAAWSNSLTCSELSGLKSARNGMWGITAIEDLIRFNSSLIGDTRCSKLKASAGEIPNGTLIIGVIRLFNVSALFDFLNNPAFTASVAANICGVRSISKATPWKKSKTIWFWAIEFLICSHAAKICANHEGSLISTWAVRVRPLPIALSCNAVSIDAKTFPDRSWTNSGSINRRKFDLVLITSWSSAIAPASWPQFICSMSPICASDQSSTGSTKWAPTTETIPSRDAWIVAKFWPIRLKLDASICNTFPSPNRRTSWWAVSALSLSGFCAMSSSRYAMSRACNESLTAFSLSHWRLRSSPIKSSEVCSCCLIDSGVVDSWCIVMQKGSKPISSSFVDTALRATCFSATKRIRFPSAIQAETIFAIVCDFPVPGGPSRTNDLPSSAHRTACICDSSQLKGARGSLSNGVVSCSSDAFEPSMRWCTTGFFANSCQFACMSFHILNVAKSSTASCASSSTRTEANLLSPKKRRTIEIVFSTSMPESSRFGRSSSGMRNPISDRSFSNMQ